MKAKIKGSNAERELIHMFWKLDGWVACRVAGSGSMNYPSPDIIAGCQHRRLVIECKVTGTDYQYLSKQEVQELIEFGKRFYAEVWIAVKFSRDEWHFLKPEDLNETNQNFVVKRDEVAEKGLKFGQVTGF